MNGRPPVKTFPLAIFGLLFTNLDLNELVQKCLKLSEHSANPFIVDAFDANLIAKIHGWKLNSLKQIEVLSSLRNINLLLTTDKYLKMICKSLGSTLAEEVSVNSLFLAVCEELDKEKKSLYILGSTEIVNKSAAIKLHDLFHQLRLVGVSTPHIFTEGENLINSQERDALLVEQINATSASLLAIDLSSPKQELWVGRISRNLKIPLVFCFSNLLEKMTKSRPVKVQDRSKEERDHEPSTFKNFMEKCRVFLKITWMALPLVFFHTISRSVFQWFYESNTSRNLPKEGKLFLSAYRSIAFIPLPQVIDETNVVMLQQHIEDALAHDVVVLDFFATRHIQPEGFYLLIETWLNRKKHNKTIFGYRPTSDIKCLMKVHRTLELFEDSLCNSLEALIAELSLYAEPAFFYDTFTQNEHLVTISILGILSNHIDFNSYLKKLVPTIGQKNCIIDLSFCTFIDSSGFAFLLNLRKHLFSIGRNLTLNSASKDLKFLFKQAAVEKLFNFT